MPLLSIGRIEFGNLANGWMMGTISLGLVYFNCTMCVTYEPISGRLVASEVSIGAAAVLAASDGSTFTNFSPTFTTEIPLSARTACNASIASVLVSGVCVFKTMDADGSPARRSVRPTSCA